MESEVAVDEVEAVEVGVVVVGVGAVAEAGVDGAARGTERAVYSFLGIVGFFVFNHVMPMFSASPLLAKWSQLSVAICSPGRQHVRYVQRCHAR
jgi:hypothetical protein